ncbi:MAG: MurT ligase domain-containing protein [Candidatus Woykebacteria bacterium]
MDARLISAVASSSVLRTVLKLSGRGATAAPGLLAEYIDPNSLRKLGNYFDRSILVTGTNGKTTTSRILGTILKEASISYVHNRAGSNLLRGLIGTLVENLSIFRVEKKIPLLEVDEPTLLAATDSLDPQVIVFNNLFRDQLDRYGEVDKIRKIWHKSLLQIPPTTTLVLNSDDHSVAHLASETKASVVYFGMEDTSLSIGKLPHASDFTSCINCGSQLRFETVYLSHLGKYKCSTCGLKRPQPDIYAKKVNLDEEKGFTADIATPKGSFEAKVALPGLFSVYNTLAAISAALVLGINLATIKRGLQRTQAAFGRSEKLEFEGKRIYIALIKNPSGFNEILRVLALIKKDKYVLLAINDLIADGRDVSWLWDVDIESLTDDPKVKRIWSTGLRAYDMALRLKYASGELAPEISTDIEASFEEALIQTPKGGTLYILPTYTAMLALKSILAKKNFSENFWED